MDMMEVSFKVKQNENEFIPGTNHLTSATKEMIFLSTLIHHSKLYLTLVTWSRNMMIYLHQRVEAYSPNPLQDRQIMFFLPKVLMDINSIGKRSHQKQQFFLTHQCQVSFFLPLQASQVHLLLKSLGSQLIHNGRKLANGRHFQPTLHLSLQSSLSCNPINWLHQIYTPFQTLLFPPHTT